MTTKKLFAIVEVDPEEAITVESHGLAGTEIDRPVIAAGVIEDGLQRQRKKARAPATTTATNAITYSTKRIERSSTSVSVD
jgi:hypothetical protein